MSDTLRELIADEYAKVSGGVTATSNVSVTETVNGPGSATVTFHDGVFTIQKSGNATVETSYTHTP